jgi:teichoic acid transport system permease protein
MFESIREIVSDNIRMLKDSWRLGLISLKQECKGTMLGWIWLALQPLMYIAVFALALGVGLRQFRQAGGDYPYLLFLASGLIPWFYIQDMLSRGSNIFKGSRIFFKLVKVPLTVLPSIYSLAKLVVFLASIIVMIIVALCFGVKPSIYLIQIIPLTIIMVVFFYFFTLLTSCFSTLSKDFFKFIGLMGLPLFWTSGVIFDVRGVDWLPFQLFLMFNPISFLVTGFRAATCENYWIFASPEVMLPFTAVFLFTVLLSCHFYNFLKSEVRDVLCDA